MKSPNISTITASLERALQNFSLNNTNHHSGAFSDVLGDEGESSASSDYATTERRPTQNQAAASSDTSVEFNSHLSLPYHWEQCLDLKTGEIYYINWRNGMKAKEDPRTMSQSCYSNANIYSEGEEDDDDNLYDSEESSSASSPSSSRDINSSSNRRGLLLDKEDHVLVVAGCKSCLMYFMVPKLVEDCPKCSGHLLHF